MTDLHLKTLAGLELNLELLSVCLLFIIWCSYTCNVGICNSIFYRRYFWSYTTSSNHGPVQTNGAWFNDILNTIFSSPATVALIVGTLLDHTLEAREAYNDRGIPWWAPFQHKDGEPRNDEFYSFPLNLDEYLPSRFMK